MKILIILANVILGLAIIMSGCSRRDEVERVESALNSEACPNHVGKYIKTSVSEVLKNPSGFDGDLVVVEGYYCAGFELSAFYENPNCESLPELGLWLKGVSPYYRSDGKKISVAGVVDTKTKGHLAKWPVGLCVSRVLETGQ